MCAHMAFIVRRFEGIIAIVSAGSVCLTTVSIWHTTGRATCQQSVLQYGQQHIVLYSELSKGLLQGVTICVRRRSRSSKEVTFA